ncbi:MAG: type II toxin-antitoxin system VapC family toxin [Gammaproteobacteria bacterium]|nr:type II toxin-antitoxin system VapC family toxin [Gammaproteobacteria bacterium]
MRALLDTHAFLWWLTDSGRLSKEARRTIADEANEVLVSAASAWEITTKHRLGKLPDAAPIATDIAGAITNQGFGTLPITLEDAERSGVLPGPHRDPFDRILIAQSLARNLVLVSNESLFDRYGIHRLW